MASEKNKFCAKCRVGGSGTFMCHGCQQSFCVKHVVEHRNELKQQMENINQEHDLLQQDFNKESITRVHPLLAQIDQWENQSIAQIKKAAETARTDLRQLIDQNTRQMQMSLRNITGELSLVRQSGDFAEIDLKRWATQLKELRNQFETPPTVRIVSEATPSTRLIKIEPETKFVINQQTRIVDSTRTIQVREHRPTVASVDEGESRERFELGIGDVSLLEQGLMAKHLRSRNNSSVCGVYRYSTGRHRIHFRIEVTDGRQIFFGILTATKQPIEDSSQLSSVYGWWDSEHTVVQGELYGNSPYATVETGDELTLTLDCDKSQILYKYERTNKSEQLEINLSACPFPWRLLTIMYGRCSVRILD